MKHAIVIPAWNAAPHLEQAVRSALSQEPVRVYCWDDGSTDATPEILERLAAEDGRLAWARSPVNAGPQRAREALLAWALADGGWEWLTYHDADDWFIGVGQIARRLAWLGSNAPWPERAWGWTSWIAYDYSQIPTLRKIFDPSRLPLHPDDPPWLTPPGCWTIARPILEECDIRWRFQGAHHDWDYLLQACADPGVDLVRLPWIGYARRSRWSPHQVTSTADHTCDFERLAKLWAADYPVSSLLNRAANYTKVIGLRNRKVITNSVFEYRCAIDPAKPWRDYPLPINEPGELWGAIAAAVATGEPNLKFWVRWPRAWGEPPWGEVRDRRVAEIMFTSRENLPGSAAVPPVPSAAPEPEAEGDRLLIQGDRQAAAGQHQAAAETYLTALERSPQTYSIYQRLLALPALPLVRDRLEREPIDLGTPFDTWSLRWRSLNQFAVRWGRAAERAAVHQRAVCEQRAQALSSPASPDFLILGAQKAGTTSLYSALCQNPRFVPALCKEVHFFDRVWEEFGDLNEARIWYESHFASATGCVTGEATPCYLAHPFAPSRIKAWYPKIKLVILLRHPVDRFISGYYHERRKRAEWRSLPEVVEQEIAAYNDGRLKWDSYLSRSLYLPQLQRWLELFSVEQILALESELFRANKQMIYDRVCDFLGLYRRELKGFGEYNAGYYPPVDEEARDRLKWFFENGLRMEGNF